jgi:hypothetical protein
LWREAAVVFCEKSAEQVSPENVFPILVRFLAMSAPAAPSKRLLPQVEFYFSDRNLSKDDFFREEIGKEDGCGCVCLSVDEWCVGL